MKYSLRLFVTGRTGDSLEAIKNLERLCSEELAGRYELEVVDVLVHPQLAEDEKILATPTVVRRYPPPSRRIIGDMNERDKVLSALDLTHGGLAIEDEETKS